MLLNCGVGEDSWESLGLQGDPLGVHPKGNQSWIFVERTDAEAETPILWRPDAKSWLIWKNPDDRKDWRWEKGMTKDEMVGWHLRLNGHEFEYTPGVGDGQEGLSCCSPWGCKELDTTEWLKWTELMSSDRFWIWKPAQYWMSPVASRLLKCPLPHMCFFKWQLTFTLINPKYLPTHPLGVNCWSIYLS